MTIESISRKYLCLFTIVSISFPTFAENKSCKPNETNAFVVKDLKVVSNPIFDESAEDTFFLHNWANTLHVITKPVVIKERLTFDEGEEVSPDDIVEAEAILRSLRYLANAEITPDYDCQNKTVSMQVETFDNWSLIPTFSFSRSGGENRSLIGVREDNLLGLGIRTNLRYREDEQRSGYQMSFSSIFPWIRHTNIALALEDNDDGEVVSFALDKPFYFLDTNTRFRVAANFTEETEDIFQNGNTRNSLLIDRETATLAYGWKLSSDNESTKRLTIGLTHQEAKFGFALDSPSIDPVLLPENRDFEIAWLNWEYFERNIVVMEDVYLINQPEDINLGWQLNARLGLEIDAQDSGPGLHSRIRVNKGLSLGNTLLMFETQYQGITNADVADFNRLDTRVEYFYRSSPLIGFYARYNSTLSGSQFLDQPIFIDDENGVRGFPTQYQQGDHRYSATAEIRWYTDWSVYQLFEVGFATFYDIGRAHGGPLAALNEDQDRLASVGLGARIYSNKASDSGVLHINFAKPIGDGDNIDSWEWSAGLRRSF